MAINLISQIYPFLVDGLNDILSPLLIFTIAIMPNFNLKKWIIIGQLILSIILLSLYSSHFFNGISVYQMNNNTLIYTIINIGKIILFAYLLKQIFNAENNSIENFDFYATGIPSVTNVITPNPNLNIKVSSTPDSVIPGQQIEYTLTLTNIGNVRAENIIMINRIPEYTSFVSSVRGNYRNGYVTWNDINLDPLETYQGSYIIRVDEDTDTRITPQILNNAFLAYNAI